MEKEDVDIYSRIGNPEIENKPKYSIKKIFWIIFIVVLIIFIILFLLFFTGKTTKDTESIKGVNIESVSISKDGKEANVLLKENNNAIPTKIVFRDDDGKKYIYEVEESEEGFYIINAEDVDLKNFNNIDNVFAVLKKKTSETSETSTSEQTNKTCQYNQDCNDNINCTIDRCVDGKCVNNIDEEFCDNDNICDGYETCNKTTGCMHGTYLNCTDNNECTSDNCNPSGGCFNTPLNTGVACSSGYCNNGLCSGCISNDQCSDSIDCTVDVCSNGTCSHTPNNSLCSFGICTVTGCNQTSCMNCQDCDLFFSGNCDYVKCHAYCSTSGWCYYNGDVASKCISLDYVCASIVKNCSNYNSFECSSDLCNLNCEWRNNQCQTKQTDLCSTMNCNDNNTCTDDSCSDGNCINTPKTCPSGQVCYNGNCIVSDMCSVITSCSSYSSQTDCTSDLCHLGCEWNNNQCTQKVVAAWKQLDEPCSNNAECITNKCENNICAMPDSFYWTNISGKNYMTLGKDQYSAGTSCGSCWAFGALGSMEAKYKIQENNPDIEIDLSEQYLIGCSGYTCSGGYLDTLKRIETKGVAEESCMPYQGKNIACPTQCKDGTSIKLWKTQGYTSLSNKGRSELQRNVIKNGPVSIVACASLLNGYTGAKDERGCRIKSCFYACSNHVFVILGFNNQGKYWRVKDSYHTDPSDPCSSFPSFDFTSCSLDNRQFAFVERVIPPA